jgi:hypothetical protein
VVSVPALGAVLVFGSLFAEGSGSPSADAHSTGHDALWLGHAWVGFDAATGKASKTAADLPALFAQVRSSGIKDLFVHDGPFNMDGTLDMSKSPNARWFVDEVHQNLPGVRVQAWLGQIVGTGCLHMNIPATRAAVVDGVRSALALGFDGVHFDFEPVPDGDPDFLTVLTEAHAVTSAAGAKLSVSVPQVEPLPGWRLPGNFVVGDAKWWSRSYLRAVATRADQVAVMAYDTTLPFAWAYRGYVTRETEIALSAVPQNVGLLIGAPAYHTRNPGHWDFAETMAASMRGIRLGVGGADLKRDFGVALYVDFAATPGDWAAYRSGWLHPH